VLAISRAALAASSVRGDSPGPLYQVLVSLEAQDVIAYGEPRDLRAGMAVEADVLLETRRLYEWVLEPLLSLTGGAASSAPQ
jgi:membrane fusion protein